MEIKIPSVKTTEGGILMNKKLLYSALSGVLAVGVLAACGGVEEEDPAMEGDNGGGEEDVEIEDDAENGGGMEDEGNEDGGMEDEENENGGMEEEEEE